MANPSEPTHFFTRVVGVTHRNSDRKSRQKIIKKCNRLDPLLLDTEEDNPHDPNAIRVLRQNGEQIGYLDAALAKQLASRIKQGYRFDAFIADLTGGVDAKPTTGVNVVIIVAPPGASVRRVRSYWESLRASKELDDYAPFEDLQDAFDRAGKPHQSKEPESDSPFEDLQETPEIIRTPRQSEKPGCRKIIVGCVIFLLLFLVCACLVGCVAGLFQRRF
jgi:hypothetical protein